jgi:hypothetical protein
MLTNLIGRLAAYFDPYELPDDAELLGGTIIDWSVAKELSD